ncbi:MAG: hypothetical protein LBK64_06985, partial [Spirochaetaceae bacterium]|nr:hypothetical protein [Spirochaetaceae bacterium]
PRHLLSSFSLLPIIIALILFAASCSNPSGCGGGPHPNAITGLTVNGTAGTINTETRTVTVTLSQDTV